MLQLPPQWPDWTFIAVLAGLILALITDTLVLQGTHMLVRLAGWTPDGHAPGYQRRSTSDRSPSRRPGRWPLGREVLACRHYSAM